MSDNNQVGLILNQIRQLSSKDAYDNAISYLNGNLLSDYSGAKNLLVYEGPIEFDSPIFDTIPHDKYFFLTERFVAKLNRQYIDNILHRFTVFDLWTEKEM
jgi:hypothetical protein